MLVASAHCNDMVEIAGKYGALLLALEHRYYGVSMPNVGDYSTENFRYLSSEQALEDIAGFHSIISKTFSLTSSNRWITFGGSYPGMMAAMARLRFPHLFFASISSSSPLQVLLHLDLVFGFSVCVCCVTGIDNIQTMDCACHRQLLTSPDTTMLLLNLCQILWLVALINA